MTSRNSDWKRVRIRAKTGVRGRISRKLSAQPNEGRWGGWCRKWPELSSKRWDYFHGWWWAWGWVSDELLDNSTVQGVCQNSDCVSFEWMIREAEWSPTAHAKLRGLCQILWEATGNYWKLLSRTSENSPCCSRKVTWRPGTPEVWVLEHSEALTSVTLDKYSFCGPQLGLPQRRAVGKAVRAHQAPKLSTFTYWVLTLPTNC